MGANTANGKGNVTAYIGYQNTEAVLAAARDFSACTIGGGAVTRTIPRTSAPVRATTTASSRSTTRRLIMGRAHPRLRTTSSRQGTGHAGSGTFVPYAGANNQQFNYGALNYLQRPDTRYQGGFFAHYEVNKELDVYTSFMFTDDHTVAQIAPSGLFLGTGAHRRFGPWRRVESAYNPLHDRHEAAALRQQVQLGAALRRRCANHLCRHDDNPCARSDTGNRNHPDRPCWKSAAAISKAATASTICVTPPTACRSARGAIWATAGPTMSMRQYVDSGLLRELSERILGLARPECVGSRSGNRQVLRRRAERTGRHHRSQVRTARHLQRLRLDLAGDAAICQAPRASRKATRKSRSSAAT